MNEQPAILLAEDNEISKDLMTRVLESSGYTVRGALDGGGAIKVLKEEHVDMALIDINMAPAGGFDVVKYIAVQKLNIPMVIITASKSSDILVKANELGVSKVMQKPVSPDRLLDTVRRILERRRKRSEPLVTVQHKVELSREELMNKVIEMADQNARFARGAPLAALVVDGEGTIIGEGKSGFISRVDPIAHAEVMAIRQATEHLGTSDLSNCVLYVTAEPDAIGKALIESVRIGKVYYALSAQEINFLEERSVSGELRPPEYQVLSAEKAQEMIRNYRR